MTNQQRHDAGRRYDVAAVRADFPQLSETKVRGKPLVYLDNAATTLKPLAVINGLNEYYRHQVANIHRGIHFLAEQGTEAYENTRAKVCRLVHAAQNDEIVFTRGTTDSINLVAQSFGSAFLKPGDEILVSVMEHHSNLVPWQMLCKRQGCLLRQIPIDDTGEIDLGAYEKLLNTNTKLVAVTAMSNVLGTINPIARIITLAHGAGAKVLVDGAQAIAHTCVDVQALDCDFYVFSGHKMYGPTGIGVLYGKCSLLEAMPPVQGGGDMIDTVTFEKTTYNVPPHRFEAGTPHVAGVIGLGHAIDYLLGLDPAMVAQHEKALLTQATKRLSVVQGVHIMGNSEHKGGIVSFVVKDVHPHDLGTLIDLEGVALRTGHLCAQPLMQRFGVPAMTRVSFAAYTTREDIDAFVTALEKVMAMVKGA